MSWSSPASTRSRAPRSTSSRTSCSWSTASRSRSSSARARRSARAGRPKRSTSSSRYQELEDRYRELGAPKLFETMQVLVATCGQAAVYGTVHDAAPFLRRVEGAVPEDHRAASTASSGAQAARPGGPLRGDAPTRGSPRPCAELRGLRARRRHRAGHPQALPVPAVCRREQGGPTARGPPRAQRTGAASSGTRRAPARA